MAAFQPADPHYQDRVRESFDKQGLMKTLGAELSYVQNLLQFGLTMMPRVLSGMDGA